MKRILLALLGTYRNFISPLLGSHCRFVPSCSEYAQGALKKKGFFLGLGLIAGRLLKCHPFHPGGFDPVDG